MASWRSLDRFLTPLDFLWRLPACSWGSWLISFFSSKNRQVYSRIIKKQQEDIKKLLRRRQEAPRHVKKCHEVSRRRSVKNISRVPHPASLGQFSVDNTCCTENEFSIISNEQRLVQNIVTTPSRKEKKMETSCIRWYSSPFPLPFHGFSKSQRWIS